MKIGFLPRIFITLVFVVSPLFSQEDVQAEYLSADALLPPLIVHDSSFFHRVSAGSFQFIDGTPVSRNEAFALISSVPENEALMREIRILRNVSRITTSLSAAVVASGIMYYFVGSSEYRREVLLSAGMIGITGVFVTFSFIDLSREKRIFRAVDNYNLRTLGLPVTGH